LAITLDCNSDFEAAGSQIKAGKTVVFPTDTVYGLGTNPRSAEGVRECYRIKERDLGKKMPVLVSDFSFARKLVNFGEKSTLLARAFWPGKVSIILPVVDATLPVELTGEDRTLAMRMPNHSCCLRLISSCGGSLIGTSANISGEEPLTDMFDPRLVELSEKADYFIRGSCGDDPGKPSTIIDASDESRIKIVREGAIPSGEILDHLENIRRTERS
jgi:L-threonylcarbamoyladenylate synthase